MQTFQQEKSRKSGFWGCVWGHFDTPPQPFFPTTDPRVAGINPVPNIDERIRKLTRELSDTHPDTENIEYEEADMNLEEIFKEDKENEQGES